MLEGKKHINLETARQEEKGKVALGNFLILFQDSQIYLGLY